jgi:hypothetical protein
MGGETHGVLSFLNNFADHVGLDGLARGFQAALWNLDDHQSGPHE